MSTTNPDHLDSNPALPTFSVAVLAPVSGTTTALADVPDPVFSSGALGRGIAIEPTDASVTAPIAGEIVTVMPHAYGIRGGGLEVLVHVGIDTVELGGKHFAPAVETGDHVRAGQPLGTADLTAITAAGFPTTVIVALTNSAELGDVVPTVHDTVTAGDVLLTASL